VQTETFFSRRGNYASYRKHIESFFETLKRHEIRPVVVFDG